MLVKHNYLCLPENLLLQSRKTFISFEDIFKHIQELQKSLSDQKTRECLLQDNKFWAELCTDLGVPNTSPNRYKLKRAYKDENIKKVESEEDGTEDALETEGAEAEESIEDLSDFHKEDVKEHTQKKDFFQDEEDKAKEENKESERPNEFGQVKAKNVDSKEVKTVLNGDGEKKAPEIEGTKEEELPQEMTPFKQNYEKEHVSKKKDLIQEEEDLTVGTAQEIKNAQQAEDVSDKMIVFTIKLIHICYVYHQYAVFENYKQHK